MKPNFIKGMLCLLLACGLLFSACKKEENNIIESEQSHRTNDAKYLGDDPTVAANPIVNPKDIPPATVELKDYSHLNTPQRDPVESCDEALSPTEFEATLQVGESASESKVACLEGLPPAGDLLFCMDLTGSMGGILNNLKNSSVNIMNAVAASIPDMNFGVISHKDYPGNYSSCGYNSLYGSNTDFPYNLDQSITPTLTDVENTINAFSVGGGADGPESYERALFETYSDAGVGWRSGTARIVVLWGDQIPHDCDLGTGDDPGRDGIMGNGDDIDMDAVIAEMATQNIILIVLTPYNLTLWNDYATLTGGQAFQINSDGSVPGGTDIAEVIATLVEESVSTINQLTLCADPPAFQSWITNLDPVAHTDITLDEPQSFDFEIEYTVPDPTPDGEYSFDILLKGDGIVYGTQSVTITVLSDSDGDGCVDDEDPFPNSNLEPTITIDGCDTGVDNQFVDEEGCTTMSDLIGECAENANNHGQFVSCVSHLANAWKNAGLISGAQKGAINSCAAQSSIP